MLLILNSSSMSSPPLGHRANFTISGFMELVVVGRPSSQPRFYEHFRQMGVTSFSSSAFEMNISSENTRPRFIQRIVKQSTQDVRFLARIERRWSNVALKYFLEQDIIDIDHDKTTRWCSKLGRESEKVNG